MSSAVLDRAVPDGAALEGVSVGNAIHRLEAALADLAAADLDPLSSDALGALVLRLTRARNVLDGVDARVTRRYAVSGPWADEGFRAPTAWLTARTTVSVGGCLGRLRTAQRAEAHPVFGSYLSAGRVTARHLDVLAEVHRRYPRLSAALDGIEPELAEYAAEVTPEELRRRLLATLHRIDPDAVDDADARRRDLDAGLQVTTLLDGWGRIEGLLPPEIHATMLAVLESARSARRRSVEDGDEGPNDPVAGSGTGRGGRRGDLDADLERQPRRRLLLDSFGHVLAAALAAAGDGRLPDVSGSRPVVTVVVPVDSLLDDGMAGSGPAWVDRTRALVGPRVLHRLLCDATVRRLLVDPEGLPLDVGRQTRVVSPALRTAVMARDRGRCRFPGCRHPIDEIHHVRPWSHGGATEQANLAGICWHHHRLVHGGRWSVRGDAGGVLEFRCDGPVPRCWRSPVPGVGP